MNELEMEIIAGLHKRIKALEKENSRLQGIIDKKEKDKKEKFDETEFEYFWCQYGKKGNKKTTKRRWANLSYKNKNLITKHVPKYVKATPNKAFRKNAETYLNQEVWFDELPEVTDSYGNKEPVRTYNQPIAKEVEDKIFKEAKELRNKNRGLSVRDRLKM